MNEYEKESVVKAQITYFKWVMSPPNNDHKLFYFSKERNKLSGADPCGEAHPTPPPKIGKNMIFLRKIVNFHTKYP